VVGMSVLSLGKGFSDRILTAPNLAPSPAPLEEASPRRQVDRKMTAQKNMDLIYKVYGVLTEALGIKEKLSKTLDFIFDLLLRIDRGMIILLDSKTGTLKDVVSKCREGVADLQYSKGVVDWVMRHKEAFMVTDADMGGKKAPDTLKLKNIKCVMAVPLISGSRLKGVLYVDSLSRPYGFRWEDIYLMRALSTPIAVAIENALLGEK